MTQIRFKNGLPLLLQPAPGSEAGLVAADSGCCCPPPPPERCWCGDLCSYFIELVEPSELAVKTPAIDCNIGFASDSKIISPSLLQSIVPVTDSTQNFSQSQLQSGGGLLFGKVVDYIQGRPDFLPPDVFVDTFFEAASDVQLGVYCSYDETGLPKFFAQISIGALAGFFGLGSGFMIGANYTRSYLATLEVPATCAVSSEKECVPSEQEFLRINTPLEITVNGDGTSSLGSLGTANEGIPLLGDYEAAKDAVDSILEEKSYTFRITARENCGPDCQRCITIYRKRETFESGSGCGEEVYEVDIDIPAGYTFPLTINITGVVDDDLKINGTLIEDNERNPPPPFPQLDCNLPHCVGGGPAGYTTTISSSPLTLTLVDNYGGNKILDVTVCLDPENAQNVNECPTVTYVSSVGEGWTSGTDACCVQPAGGDNCRVLP